MELSNRRKATIKQKGKKLYLYDVETLEFVDTYDSISEAEEDMFLEAGRLRNAIRRKYLTGIYTTQRHEPLYVFVQAPLEELGDFISLKKATDNAEIRKAKTIGFEVKTIGFDVYIGKYKKGDTKC